MSRIRKILSFGSLAALALLLAFGCSLLQRDAAVQASGGWYIKLQVQAPGSKGITVTDFSVTGLNIQVRDPAGEVLKTIDWAVADGTQTYTVPVKQMGEHHLEVTHFGERDGQTVQATESAAISIQAMKITVIDIVPGCIGVIRVAGQEVPPTIDLTGYWENTVNWADGSVERNLTHMMQSESTVTMSGGISFTLTGLTFSQDIWIPDLGGYVTIAGTVAADGNELNGTLSGFPFGGGSGTMHMVRYAGPFGRLDLDGICQGQPVSLHTDYGYATRGEMISTYTRSMSLNWGGFRGELRLASDELLSAGTYLVTEEGEQAGQIQVVLWDGMTDRTASGGSVEVSRYDDFGMAGSFDLNFPEGRLTGSFDVSFGASTGDVSLSGWLSGTTANSYSQVSVWTRTPFMLGYLDQDLEVRMNGKINGQLRTGQFIVPNDVHMELEMSSALLGRLHDWPSRDLPGTMTISSLSESGIAGSFAFNFQEGGSVSGSFDLSFLE